MALYHLGSSKEIANVDATNERSEEARVMRVFWDIAKEKALSVHSWTFARRIIALSLIEEDPTDEWGFEYAYPSDAVTITKLQSGIRRDTRQSIIPFEVASNDDDQKVIHTDLEDAVCEYTKNITNYDLFTSEFTLALSYLLASLASVKLSKGDPMKAKDNFEKLFHVEVRRAISKGMNEQVNDVEPDAEIIRLRE